MSSVNKVFLVPSDAWTPQALGVSPAEKRILSLPDPKGGRQSRKYLLIAGSRPALLELQHQQTTSYASWFVDQTVISDGSMVLGTPVDILFWLLPYMAKLSSRFPVFSASELLREVAPDDAAAASSSSPDAQTLRKVLEVVFKTRVEQACSSVCDVSGDSETSRQYRFNERKAITALVARTGRVAQLMRTKTDAALEQLRAQQDTFPAVSRPLLPTAASSAPSSSPSTAEAAPTSLASLEAAHWTAALDVTQEYLSAEWINKLKAAIPALKEAAVSAATSAGAAAVVAASSSSSSAATKPAAKPASHNDDDDDHSFRGDEEEDDGLGDALAVTGRKPSGNAELAPAEDKAAMWNKAALEDDQFGKFARVGTSSSGAPATASGGGEASASATSPASVGSSGAGSSSSSSSAAKRQPSSAPTLAQRKLAQTNIKGMKPMTAFFGAVAKKP